MDGAATANLWHGDGVCGRFKGLSMIVYGRFGWKNGDEKEKEDGDTGQGGQVVARELRLLLYHLPDRRRLGRD